MITDLISERFSENSECLWDIFGIFELKGAADLKNRLGLILFGLYYMILPIFLVY